MYKYNNQNLNEVKGTYPESSQFNIRGIKRS